MVDVSGIPNMGFGGGGYFGGSASLGLPAMSGSQIDASMGWNPNAAQYNPWANTPGGFGGQTDYYSALGAAYGRQTGGFGGGSPYGTGYGEGIQPYSPFADYGTTGIGSLFDPGTYAPAPQTFEGMWGGGYQAPQYQLPDEITQGQSYRPQMPSSGGEPEWMVNQRNKGMSPYGTGYGEGIQPSDSFYYGQPSANPSYFDPSSYGGQSPIYQSWQNVPAYDPNSFANRFGDWGSNYGTPSQYYTGENYGGGGGSPPGFSGTYGVDSPGGALPLRSPFSNPYGVENSQAGG